VLDGGIHPAAQQTPSVAGRGPPAGPGTAATGALRRAVHPVAVPQ